jgi:hypothetical protein
MAEEKAQRRPGGRKVARMIRGMVSADPGGTDFGQDGPDSEGSAGVREPRRPKPKGPVSGAGARLLPGLPLTASLPDPRQ